MSRVLLTGPRSCPTRCLSPLEAGERAAIEAVGQFPITIEEALPQQVAGAIDVAKTITESGLEMADRLHTEYDVLRNVIDSAARSLSSRDAAKSKPPSECRSRNSWRVAACHDPDGTSCSAPVGVRGARGSPLAGTARGASRAAFPPFVFGTERCERGASQTRVL